MFYDHPATRDVAGNPGLFMLPTPPTEPVFDAFRTLLATLPPPDLAAVAQVRARDAQLTKPPGSLGRLEELVEWLAAWQARGEPTLDRPTVVVFAANHGVVAQGVSPFPPSVTAQMLRNFSAGGASVNQICAAYGAGLKVFELALNLPTRDITEAPAMEARECAATIAFGMEAIAGGADLLALGEMGIGNTTIAAAIYHGLYGGEAADWVGRGTGVDEAGLRRKTDAVARAVRLHAEHLSDPFELLRRLGGREIAAMAGAILAARMERIPVLLDGYVVCAAAAILHALDPASIDHCVAAHVSAEGAHGRVLRLLGKKPLLDLGMRLGEGSGAALAIGVVKAALACHKDMATFDSAGVDNKA
jgi:nicotinate-nucleotide--dimethylbenzimidazole phosphoribosyltransferase